MELDAPPASPSMAGVGAVGTSSAAADGVLDGIAVVEAVVAVGAVGTRRGDRRRHSQQTPAAESQDPPAGMVSGGGGATLGAEGEEALTSKGWVKTRRHDK